MILFNFALILAGLVGAAASLANLQHARDTLSPEPARHRLAWSVKFCYFALSVAAWSVVYRAGTLEPGRTAFLILWMFFWLTAIAAGSALIRAVRNARQRTDRARRWHGSFRHVVPALLLLLLVFAGVGGCGGGGTLNAAAVDSTFRRIADRHDKYVTADATLTDLARRTALRDTALLRSTLDEANKTVTPAATQPIK